jgi:hypothetical protein
MLAFVFAMITLQNAAPDPMATAAASIGQRLTGQAPATGLLQGLDTTSPLGDVKVTVGCTYGVPRLGSNLLSDTSELTRFSESSCDPSSQANLVPGLGVAPTGLVLFRPLLLAPRVGTAGSTAFALPSSFTMEQQPARSFAIQHLALPREMSGGFGTTAFQVHASTPATSTLERRLVDPHRTSTAH